MKAIIRVENGTITDIRKGELLAELSPKARELFEVDYIDYIGTIPEGNYHKFANGEIIVVVGADLSALAGTQATGTMLFEFLGNAGLEGWEVVGMAGVRDGSELVLKRPLLEEENDESE